MAKVEAGHREMDPLFFTISVEKDGRSGRRVIVAPELGRVLKEEIHDALENPQNGQPASLRFGPERHPGELPVTTCTINSGLYCPSDALDHRAKTAVSAVEQVLGNHGIAYTFANLASRESEALGEEPQRALQAHLVPGTDQRTLF